MDKIHQRCIECTNLCKNSEEFPMEICRLYNPTNNSNEDDDERLTIAESKKLMHDVVELKTKLLDSKKEIINKACGWLRVNYGHFDGSIEDLLRDFSKYMNEC